MFAYFVLTLSLCFPIDNTPMRISHRKAFAIADAKQGHYTTASMHNAIVKYYESKGTILTLPDVVSSIHDTNSTFQKNDVSNDFMVDKRREQMELDSDL